MIYCGDCKIQYGLHSEIEKEVKRQESDHTFCEFCAYANKPLFSAIYLVSDIVTRLVGNVEVSAKVKLEQAQADNETRKLDQEDRKLDQEDRRLNLLEKEKGTSAPA